MSSARRAVVRSTHTVDCAERNERVVSMMAVLGRLVRTVLVLGSGVTATVFLSPLISLVASRRPDSRWIDVLLRMWSRAWLWPAGMHVRVHGGHHLDPNQACVVVSNHLSNLDIMVHFLGLPIPLRFLAKEELYRLPLLGSAMRASGMIEVDRKATDLGRINRQARDLLARGKSVIVYPEGTRSRSGNIGQFKMGAFAIAAAAGVPVLPVTIWGTREAWPPERKLICGGPVDLVIGPPILPGNAHGSEPEYLRDEAFRAVKKNYEVLRVHALSEESGARKQIPLDPPSPNPLDPPSPKGGPERRR